MSATYNDPSLLEAAFAAAPDQGFRNRAIGEYRSVSHWTLGLVNWDNANILDFGCGNAIASVAVALRHPGATVTGVDIIPLDEEQLRKTLKKQIGADIPENFRFKLITEDSGPDIEGFDLIYSWSVFEHIREVHIQRIFSELKSRLASNGVLFVQVDPLYFSPRGSHLYGIVSEPWHHLLMSINELKEIVMPDETHPGRRRLWQQFIELNRLTADQIINYGKASGLALKRRHIFVTDQAPDQRLVKIYSNEVLRTFGFQALYS